VAIFICGFALGEVNPGLGGVRSDAQSVIHKLHKIYIFSFDGVMGMILVTLSSTYEKNHQTT
jgi:hypothetical protein